MSNSSKTCRWVLAGGIACGKPTTYKMERDDDDGNMRRCYNTWCPEHEQRARQLQEEDEDE